MCRRRRRILQRISREIRVDHIIQVNPRITRVPLSFILGYPLSRVASPSSIFYRPLTKSGTTLSFASIPESLEFYLVLLFFFPSFKSIQIIIRTPNTPIQKKKQTGNKQFHVGMTQNINGSRCTSRSISLNSGNKKEERIIK